MMGKNIDSKSKKKKIQKSQSQFETTPIETDESIDNYDSEESKFIDTDDHKGKICLIKKRRNVEDESSTPLKKKKIDKHLYKPPTVEELNQLKETENLFHSHLFRFQIEEVLNEVRIKDKYKLLFDNWFSQLKTCIESIEETEEFEFPDQKFTLESNISVPTSNIPTESNITCRFLKPSKIDIVGSYSLNTTIGPNFNVDVMVVMPNELFDKQDYLNYRYHKKKAFYLSYIACNLENDIVISKTFIGNSQKPMLKLIPNGKLGKKITVQIHISAEENSFKLNRFSPEKNNVRPRWFFEEDTTENIILTPTPHYNAMVLNDLTMHTTNLKMIEIIRDFPNLRDGIILLKIWSTQREFNRGIEAFNGHIIAMLVAYLLGIRKIHKFMSSYQVVRNVWNYLVQNDWTKDGITMCNDDTNLKNILEYHKYYDCVFLDFTGCHNIAAHISKNTYLWVQKEAELSLKHLDNVHVDSFQNLFMRKVSFYKAFDHIICFHDTTALKEIIEKSSNTDRIDYGIDKRNQAIKILIKTLHQGLGNRVSQISVLPDELEEWKCTKHLSNDIRKIIIGLNLNPDSCFNIIDKGPEANLPEANEFRKLWGQRSELRRFQDGSICEAVVWSKGKTFYHKRKICKIIVNYLLQTLLNFKETDFVYIADQMEEVLSLPKIKITKFPYGTGEEITMQVLQAFDSLEKNLMSLSELPLSIVGAQASNSVCRFTDVFPPLASTHKPDQNEIGNTKTSLKFQHNRIHEVPKYVQPLEVSLQLSLSGKWPEELEAIRKTKAAFHLEIAQCLRKQHHLKTYGNYSYVDVLKDGFVFRLQVAHQKEIALLKQTIDDKGVTKYRDNDESIDLEDKLFNLPKLTSALRGLHTQQPSFGVACRLTKRWLSAQLIDDFHMPDIVVELIVASMYLTPEPYRPAQMPQVAFLRILDFFARSIWNTDPIIVNLNEGMSKEEIVAVESLYRTARDTLPPLFISTPYDQQKSLWTRKSPTLLILNRISALAKTSLKLFEDLLFQWNVIDVKPIFRPPLSEYNCLIYLKSCFNPRKLQAIDIPNDEPEIAWHTFKPHSKAKIPIVGFDPVQCYLKELRMNYGEFALFFHDTYGGMVIGVLFKPTALDKKEFKLSNLNGRKINADGQLVLNVSAMIEDFHILGKDLIESIDILDNNILN